ncbi:type IV pilus twitching motility protein PilT [Limnofasciculus baicalensis]|uniref:PilT/PilU family type 4a pilus ATPase n=1 Tax=Limnofasciculus baicalensis BBK-W-15 TaxID=2699891 RepID=A0AAE3GRT5_9CYAN|nr:PilT/PilU family type 4a pilus ATPase [Limnofasciculus baicalensis]MCP2728787.1 PilT/PilU family type 4a pilus ATPase [Limnofasciculus baicalensis BBK-W-15]
MNTIHSATHRQSPHNTRTPPPPPPLHGSLPAPPPASHHTLTIKHMVKEAHAHKASDIHVRVGQIPRFRIRGEMVIAKGYPKVTPEMFEAFLTEMLIPSQRKEFAETKELDAAIYYPGFLRCRVNCFESLTGGAIVLRLISLDIPAIDDLGLPQILKDIVHKPQGLVLVTGPTGCGKSTTLAAMIRHINETVYKHIVTIEDPIEYVHTSQRSLISQREVGLHTNEFNQALRAVLREDPDIILIGEMRDRITVNTAIQAAQTGHLVFGTLHTRSAINAVNRLLNLYPPEEHTVMRVQIVESLVAVIAQLLLPTTDKKRLAVHDILINTPAMQDYLIKGDDDEAFRLMASNTNEGMQVMNQAIYEHLLNGKFTIEEAVKASPDPHELERQIRSGGIDSGASARDWMMMR